MKGLADPECSVPGQIRPLPAREPASGVPGRQALVKSCSYRELLMMPASTGLMPLITN